MRIISRGTLIEYYTRNSDARTALEEWFQKTRKAEWTCFADIKRTFGSADNVGNQRYVFNVRGNHYRLVAVVKFTIQTVYIRFVGSDAKYDKIDVRSI